MTQLTFSSNVYWKICFQFCILEQIIVTVLFICISSINNKRSSLRFQSTTAPTNGGWSACDLLGCTANEALSRSSKFRSPKIESFLMVLNKLFSKLRMFWSKLCKSSWNCAWNLAFPVFISPIVWNMCENLHYESVYFKELHNRQEYYWPTIYRTGAAVMSTITSIK